MPPITKLIKRGVRTAAHLPQNIRDYNNLRKFMERYGYRYDMNPLIIFDDAKLDKLTNQLARQHNRFTRGVSVTEARRYYGFPKDWTDEQVAEYCLTHPHSPTKLNSGGNPGQKPVLYTSNSLDLSKLYADGDGYIGILQRPVKSHPDRSKMLEMNDFRFNKMEGSSPPNPSVTTDEPFIYQGRIPESIRKGNKVEGGLVPEIKGRVRYRYTPVKPGPRDAQANAGSFMFPTQRPYDPDFRHYLFRGDPDEGILELTHMTRYSKPKGTPSTDYKPHSTGLTKKKSSGGTLKKEKPCG